MRLTTTVENNRDVSASLLAEEQLRLLYQGFPVSLVANIFLATLLLMAQWAVVDHSRLLLWSGSLLLTLICRCIAYYRYLNQLTQSKQSIAFHFLLFRLGVFVTGIIWGNSGIWLFPSQNIPHQFLIAFVLAGLTSGAITSLAMDKVSAALLVVPAILPVTIRLFMESTTEAYTMAAMVGFFMVYVLLSASRLQRDLHESVRLRAMLGDTNELLERSNAAALIGTWDIDVSTMQSHWSTTTKRIHEVPDDFSCSVTEIATFYKAGEHRNTIVRAFSRAIEQGASFDEELLMVTAKGNERWVRVIGTPEFVDGVCLTVYGTFQDITERKRADEIKSEFISTVSHELRTPLTAIRASLGVINGGKLGSLPEPIKKLIDIAHKNSLRLLHLINDLLDMDKLIAGEMRFDLQEQEVLPLIEYAITVNQSYADQYNVTLVVQANNTNPRICVDAQRMQQVLANLLSNAIKFSPLGAAVIVDVTELQQRVRIAVIDQGIGIAPAFRSRIFQKFSQADASDSRQKGGTGLGLAITRELVTQMKGVIDFESVEGAGSTFWVEFDVY